MIFNTRELTRSEIFDYSTSVFLENGQSCLKIRGNVISSSWGIQKYVVLLNGNRVDIKAKMKQTNGNYYGSIDFAYCPPAWVDEVYFLDGARPIWERH